eukprot:COSAG05_NODE_1206_length_5525_cov_6.815149_2_plen_38_part_00
MKYRNSPETINEYVFVDVCVFQSKNSSGQNLMSVKNL